MKKTIILLTVLMLVLCGCDIDEKSFRYDTRETDEQSDYNYGIAAQFSEYTLYYTDPDGFSYEATCKISPWILNSDTYNLKPTWESISGGKELPTLNTWGFQNVGGTYRYSELYTTLFESKIDDMYYAVGTLTIKNTTNGFSFSKDRIGYPNVQIINSATSNLNKQMITRIYFGNNVKTSALAVQAKAKMTADNWGPVPFVIAYAEQFNPKHPEGVNYDKIEGLQLYLCHGESSNKDLVTITINHI